MIFYFYSIFFYFFFFLFSITKHHTETGSAFHRVTNGNHDQIGNRIWVAPFTRDSIHNVTRKEDINSEQPVPTLRDVLKTRPKTACVMECSTIDQNIAKSKHEILVNLLNVMETRRLRKSAFSARYFKSLDILWLGSNLGFNKLSKILILVFITFIFYIIFKFLWNVNVDYFQLKFTFMFFFFISLTEIVSYSYVLTL